MIIFHHHHLVPAQGRTRIELSTAYTYTAAKPTNGLRDGKSNVFLNVSSICILCALYRGFLKYMRLVGTSGKKRTRLWGVTTTEGHSGVQTPPPVTTQYVHTVEHQNFTSKASSYSTFVYSIPAQMIFRAGCFSRPNPKARQW